MGFATELVAAQALSTERLEAELCQQAAHLDAAQCRWLLLLAEFDRREAYGSWECRSSVHFLNWRCGVAVRTGRDLVRVARALTELPALTAAFSRGELSYSKARAITRVATPATEEMLVELARHLTVAQLERVVRGRQFVARRDAAAVQASEELRVDQDDETHSASVRGHVTPEDGALLLAALERSRLTLMSETSASGSREPPGKPDVADSADKPRRPTNVDALRAMCQTVLAGGVHPAAGPDRTRVVVHVHPGTGRGHLHDGPELAPETVRRLCCDATVQEVLREGRLPYDVGRRSRQPSAKQRLHLLVRDGGCTFPGCAQRRFVDAHHLVHWLDGGETDVANLILLCNRHHRAVHEGGYRVVLNASGTHWTRPDGTPVDPSAHPPVLEGPGVVEQNQQLGLGITPDTPVARWDGSGVDVSWCVESLLAAEERADRAAN